MAGGCEATPTDEVFVPFLATVYEHLVKLTPPCRGLITRFHAIKPPDISIKDYLDRIQRYFGCSNECFVLSLVYIDRIVKMHTDFSVSILNVHRLLITSIMLAAKFFDDVYYSNAFYARVGGVRTREINILEAHFLSLLDFHLFVSPTEYDQYRQNVLAAVSLPRLNLPVAERPPVTASPTMRQAPQQPQQCHQPQSSQTPEEAQDAKFGGHPTVAVISNSLENSVQAPRSVPSTSRVFEQTQQELRRPTAVQTNQQYTAAAAVGNGMTTGPTGPSGSRGNIPLRTTSHLNASACNNTYHAGYCTSCVSQPAVFPSGVGLNVHNTTADPRRSSSQSTITSNNLEKHDLQFSMPIDHLTSDTAGGKSGATRMHQPDSSLVAVTW